MYDPLDEQLREAVAAGAPYRDPMDEVTAVLFGELFARRTRYDVPQRQLVEVAPAGWGRSEPVSPQRYASPFEDAFDDPDDQEEAEMAAAELEAEERAEMLAELADARRRALGDAAEAVDFADVDPEQPIDIDVDDDDGEEDDDEPRPSPVEAQQIWDERLDELYRSGARQVTTAQLTEWLSDVRRERTFLYRQRDRWEAAKCIVPNPDADGWDLIGSPLERRQGPPHGG